ncbi:MAG: hypothetical protein CM15mP103_02220 [Gammaproteobacteria bacterium]|nr:MAG: hypothetical protein CM15mP103_02220 [Gammaproteobacteria bacterium]
MGGRYSIKTALKDATECMALLKDAGRVAREEPFEGFCETLAALEQHSPMHLAPSTYCGVHATRRKSESGRLCRSRTDGPRAWRGIQAAPNRSHSGNADNAKTSITEGSPLPAPTHDIAARQTKAFQRMLNVPTLWV